MGRIQPPGDWPGKIQECVRRTRRVMPAAATANALRIRLRKVVCGTRNPNHQEAGRNEGHVPQCQTCSAREEERGPVAPGCAARQRGERSSRGHKLRGKRQRCGMIERATDCGAPSITAPAYAG